MPLLDRCVLVVRAAIVIVNSCVYALPHTQACRKQIWESGQLSLIGHQAMYYLVTTPSRVTAISSQESGRLAISLKIQYATKA